MTIPQLAIILQSAFAAALLMVVALALVPLHIVDTFRQALFSVRDELFDYAAAGNIEFSHPAYRLLRQQMNSFIRYAHRLTFFQICLSVIRWKMFNNEPPLDWMARWESALATIPDGQTRDDLRRFHSRATSLTIKTVLLASPALWVIVLVGVMTMIIRAGWSGLQGAVHTAASATIECVVDPRLIEEDAIRCAA